MSAKHPEKAVNQLVQPWLVLGLLCSSAFSPVHGAGWPFASDERINTMPVAMTEPTQQYAADLPVHHQLSARREHNGVTAVVFHQDAKASRVLNCYLERDLKGRAGGVIDDVIWVVDASPEAQQEHPEVDQMLMAHPGIYSKAFAQGSSHAAKWKVVSVRQDRLYLYIDNHVSFIQKGALKAMVDDKVDNNDFLYISANIINHQSLVAAHMRLGALTALSGPGSKWAAQRDECLATVSTWASQWQCAALVHARFLADLREGRTDKYDMHRWDFHAESLEAAWDPVMFLFHGRDFLAIQSHDHSAEISRHSGKTQRHSGCVGAAIAALFAYPGQKDRLQQNTRILQEYQALAEYSMPVCSSWPP